MYGRLHEFKFHPMYKMMVLTHLIFVDDLMVFCKGEEQLIARVKEALTHLVLLQTW